ncbi:amino acid adenylation domain-containing protein [Solihabitans fulvus]|uniref:Phenyloxazoline synthase MbtB n=1 Tax=Solihabitans fulvus TaxID=1892852 RepID=A0A5B2XSD8_9PSEU|nr:non-ribosomal peptide synthetase [Solihabitans fulvus]KAA2265804.1 amino acid adenylation domain-containing protein [Solihabitans fulvus]
MTTEDLRGPVEVLADLESMGVELWLDGAILRYRAPHGVMTAERLAALRARRQEVIGALEAAARPTAVRPDPAGRYEPFPLTDVQSAYLTGRGGGFPYGAVGCHGYGELRFDQVEPARLEAAWRALVDRHDMLRAVVGADGTQQVREQVPAYRIRVVDLGAATAEQLRAAIETTRADLDHRVYQPGEWPLFDLVLTRSDAAAILHFSIDFLVADFVSIQQLLAELDALYRDPAALPAGLEITFRDVLLADRAARSGPTAHRDRAYWWDRIDTLPGPPDVPVLPVERALPRFRRLVAALSGPEWTLLRDRARTAGVTPTCAVLAAYAEVIRKWCRRKDFTLNVTVLNRPGAHPQIGQVVGDFTSVELLAVRHQSGEPFRDRAARIQATLWEDMDHRSCSGIDVMRELRKRGADGLTIFPFVFTSSVGLARDREAGGGIERLVHGISQTPQVWLDCQVMEHATGLSFNWDVREGVFSDGLPEAMFDAFEALLRDLAASARPWDAAGAVPVPAAQLASRPPADAAAAIGESLLPDGVLARAREHPDRPAVHAGDRTLTYRELVGWAGAVAAAIRGWGTPAGSIVAVAMDKGARQVAAVLGVLFSGCAYVPIETSQPIARQRRILADVGAVGLLTQSWRPGETHGLPSVAVDTLPNSTEPPTVTGAAPDDLAYVIYTSGSTGSPKGVTITHRAALNTIDEVNRRFEVGPGDRVLGLSNLAFDLSVYDIFGTLSAGGCLVLPDADRRTDPAHWADLIDQHGITLWNSVPAQFEMLIAYLRTEPDRVLATLRLALLSGDWILVSLPPAARLRLPGLRLISLGGATEASIWSIMHPIEPADEGAASIPYGRPLANQTVEVLDADLDPVPDLVAGELFIGGAGLSTGYLGDAEKTAERFITHPVSGRRLYRTGDLGRYLPGGAIEFLGREDSQVKIRGHRVELAEVEAALVGHPAVRAAAVVAVGQRPDPVRLAAFVEPAAREPVAAGVDALRTAAVEGSRALRAEVRDDEMLAFAHALDATALAQMLHALCQEGLFADPARAHTMGDILTGARVAPRHHRLVRRWVRALAEEGLLDHDEEADTYRRIAEADGTTVAAGWRRVEGLVPEVERRTELIQYFRTTARHLSELIRGELDPLTLLFPEGRTEIHEVAYNGMFLSRYVNRLLIGVATELAGRHDAAAGPFQVLEVGAGVGGTSVDLIPALAGFDVAYRFTDVSEFFLNNARNRFRDHPWVSYGRFDMNQDFRTQRLPPNSYDLIVCANVLHYAHGADATLATLRELLRPGGWILFIEATRDSYQIMTSMEFLFDEGIGEFDDVRRAGEQTFLTRPQWLAALRAAGADGVLSLPEDDPITDQMGMHVFAARFKSDRCPVTRADVEHHLTGQLPDHMLPYQLQVVDRLPLTGNGKVDRGALRSWLAAGERTGAAAGGGEPPAGELEQRLARVWQRMLRVERIGRAQNFFELGGDSLLAAQLAGEIREHVPEAAGIFYDDMLRLILQSSTVASLAARMGSAPDRCGEPPVPDRPSSLVPLGPGTGTVVVVHDGTGTLAAYRPLLERLDGAALAGLVVADPDRYLGTVPTALLDQVAAEYTQALRAAGHDRLRLVGHGFGGILAAELARQLTEVGVRVERLVVVATEPPGPSGDGDAPSLLRREFGAEPPADVELDVALEVFRHSTAAAAQPLLPYAGDITLVRPRTAGPQLTAYWAEICLGDLEIVDVDATAGDCLLAATQALAELLGDAP